MIKFAAGGMAGERVMRAGWPLARPGMRIGLLGGSFDPPHAGHVHITREALKRFGLDRVWWLVTPGNPLKKNGPAPMARRLEASRRIMRDPRVEITDIESRLGTRYTSQTIEALIAAYPGVRFTWLMGGDSLADIYRWERWPTIFANVPVGILARPGHRIWARTSHAARLFRGARIPAAQSHLLGSAMPPAWCYVKMPLVAISSTEIRARGEWS
jgi:nicotinate-nucleotide adenylyltransferase